MGCGRDNAGGCSVSPLETSHHPQLFFTGPRGRPMTITSVSRGWDRITDQVYLRKEGFILVHSS